MLEINGLIVQYGQSAPALNALDLRVEEGQIVAVVGGNGAGKSTLMRAISCVLGFHSGRVSAGDIRLRGRAIQDLGPVAVVKCGIAHVPEGRRVFGDMTVEDNLRAGAATVGGRVGDRMDEAYELFPVLADRLGQRAGLLSGGEQQMLAIARGLMSKPSLLLLDEPSLGLAPRIVDQIGDIVSRIRERGTSVLLVEQNAAMALSVADTGYVLEQGAAVLSGPSAALQATDAVQQLYLGGSGSSAELDRGEQRPLLARWTA